MITLDNYKQIYETIRADLVAETTHRKERATEEWIVAERKCVLHVINRLRAQSDYAPVGLEAVERAERMAVGHSDYLSKYAHAAADLVFRKDAV